jgi:arylsulfatase A-like enzyme
MGTKHSSYVARSCAGARAVPILAAVPVVASVLAVLLAVAPVSCSDHGARRLNVLLISIDSLRADHLDCYGYRSATGAPTSPSLDQFAKEGVLFEHAVSTTSWTRPSHHALFTGMPDLAHGAVNDEKGLSPQCLALPEVLQGSGYSTAGFFSGPYLDAKYGFEKGFDVYENASGVEERIAAELADSIAKIQADPALTPEEKRRRVAAAASAITEDSYHRASTANRVTDRAIRWLEERKGAAAPFFLFAHYFDVHYDFAPPEERYAARFWPDGRRPRINGDDFFLRDDVNAAMPAADLAGVKSYYDGEILWVDEQVGRLLKRVDEIGLRDDTLVVVVSDHGDEFFEHGAKGHRQNLFEPTLEVVTMARLPGKLPAGRRVAPRISLVDVAPTIVDLTGTAAEADKHAAKLAPLLHGMWGRSVLPMVAGVETGDRDCIGFLLNTWQKASEPVDTYALWAGTRKVIVSRRFADDAEQGAPLVRKLHVVERTGRLFDLATDPDEKVDLSKSTAPADLAALARFDATFAADGPLGRLLATFEIGPSPPPLTEVEQEMLKKLGYAQAVAPPPQLPRGTKLEASLLPLPRFPR